MKPSSSDHPCHRGIARARPPPSSPHPGSWSAVCRRDPRPGRRLHLRAKLDGHVEAGEKVLAEDVLERVLVEEREQGLRVKVSDVFHEKIQPALACGMFADGRTLLAEVEKFRETSVPPSRASPGWD
jgi:hypothetical protein